MLTQQDEGWAAQWKPPGDGAMGIFLGYLPFHRDVKFSTSLFCCIAWAGCKDEWSLSAGDAQLM